MHVDFDSRTKIENLKSRVLFKKVEVIKDEFFGSSPPSVFVGSKLKYPNVNVGILSPPEQMENAWLYDAQNYWSKENFGIRDILELRANLVNSRFQSTVYSSSKFLDLSKEIAMAIKPVDIEIKLAKKIKLVLNFDNFNMPMGPRAPLKKIRITENPKVHSKVEKVVSDTDLKATEAINYLYKNKFDEHNLSKLLSIGLFGLKKNRKLVPTRWSITAVDDSIGRNLIKEIKDYNIINDYMLYFGKFMGNYYLIMFFPEVFNYELFEMYLPGSSWDRSSRLKVGSDFESYNGRKNYASNTVGGYYASRLAVLEFLNGIKRQASVLVLRFETDEYWASLGVWVVRSAARKSLEAENIVFESKEKMLEYCKDIFFRFFKFDVSDVLNKSKLLNIVRDQRKLKEFF